jgi:hypothetical protein
VFGQQEAFLFQSLAFTPTSTHDTKVEVQIFLIGDFCGYWLGVKISMTGISFSRLFFSRKFEKVRHICIRKVVFAQEVGNRLSKESLDKQ